MGRLFVPSDHSRGTRQRSCDGRHGRSNASRHSSPRPQWALPKYDDRLCPLGPLHAHRYPRCWRVVTSKPRSTIITVAAATYPSLLVVISSPGDSRPSGGQPGPTACQVVGQTQWEKKGSRGHALPTGTAACHGVTCAAGPVRRREGSR